MAGEERAKGRNVGNTGRQSLEARAWHAIVRTLVFNGITLAAVSRMPH